MQDCYAGDIGDYFKLALLRSLAFDQRLGVAWYSTQSSVINGDGRHTRYLDDERWAKFAPALYTQLKPIGQSSTRKIASLEECLSDIDVKFVRDAVPPNFARKAWFNNILQKFSDRSLVFVDPDNGIAPLRYNPGRKIAEKSVTLDEITQLHWPLRPVLIYHHQSRYKGGHIKEIVDIGQRLIKIGRPLCGIRAKSYSPRVFFLLDPTVRLWDRAEKFATDWSPHVSFHALTDRGSAIDLPAESPYSEEGERRVSSYLKIHARQVANGKPDPFNSKKIK